MSKDYLAEEPPTPGAAIAAFVSPFGGSAGLHYACGQNQLETVRQMLVESKENINRIDSHGFAPVHYAVWNANRDLVRLLLDNGADINIQAEVGLSATPLHMAVRGENPKMAKLLLMKGADSTILDSQQETAQQLAEESENKDIHAVFFEEE